MSIVESIRDLANMLIYRPISRVMSKVMELQMNNLNSLSLQPSALLPSINGVTLSREGALAESIDARLNTLLLKAQDPMSTAVQKGQALGEADRLNGGRVEITVGQNTTSYQLAGKTTSAGTSAKPLGAIITTTDFDAINPKGEFQQQNKDRLADGQFIGGAARGTFTIYSSKTPLSNVPYISPRDEITGDRAPERPNGSVIFTNGIDTTPDVAGQQAQTIANMTNNNVRVVYSITDVAKQVGLLANTSATNPAVSTMSREIQSAARQGKPLHLFGHSGGATTINNALHDAKAQLRQQYGYNSALDTRLKGEVVKQHPSNKAIDDKIEKQLGAIKVETTGSPVDSWKVDGPKYVHWVNSGDVVGARGIKYTSGGKNAVYVNFTSGSYFDGTKAHNLDRYLNVREEQGGFDAVYNRYSGTSLKTYPTFVNVQDSYKNRY
jgi:hypothetical protein